MEEELISSVRYLGSLPMYAAVAFLVFINRGKQQSAVYDRSRYLIAAATLLLGIQFTIQYLHHLREQSVTLCWVVNLAFYVVVTPLYNIAELNLLRAGHGMKERYKRSGIFIALAYVILAAGYLTGTLINDPQPWRTATFAVAFVYFLHLIEISRVLYREIKEPHIRLTDTELTARHQALRYTARVMHWIILLSLFSPWVGMSSSLLLNSIYGSVMFLLLLIFIGLFLIYGWDMAKSNVENTERTEVATFEAENHLVVTMTEAENYEEEAVSEPTEEEVVPELTEDSESEPDDVRQRIEQWVAQRRYTNPSLTINEALREMGISATALSYYLEKHPIVQVNRKWLPYLRIEEAKRIMLAHPEYSLEHVAEACGYANNSNLTRAFKLQEGVSPSAWLAKNM